jgi:hypothetical protein
MPHYQAANPDPPDGAKHVGLSPVLSWTPGDGAVSRNVYLAEDREDIVNFLLPEGQTEPPLQLNDLKPFMDYYWRVDEIRSGGQVTEGPVWMFTTVYHGACTPSTYQYSVVTSTLRGSAGRSFGVATVTVVDNCGTPAGVGFRVDGAFNGDFNESAHGFTDGQGVAVLQTATELKKPSFGFVLDILTPPPNP